MNRSTGAAVNVIEIYQGGQASASSINIMMFARDSTLAAIPTALAAPVSDGPLDTRTGRAVVKWHQAASGLVPQHEAHAAEAFDQAQAVDGAEFGMLA